MRELRDACATVAQRAAHVRVQHGGIAAYAATLPLAAGGGERRAPQPPADATERERQAAYWLTLNAINFGSGWFPTLRKLQGRSGYRTIEAGVKARFQSAGPWPAGQLAEITATELAAALGQRPGHELMALFAAALRELGAHVEHDFGGSFAALVDSAGGSAVTLALQLGRWPSFADSASYDELQVAFLKRAQIAAADLHRAGVLKAPDLAELTMFADNLVPHVLRLDGVLEFAPELVERIERGELIEHCSREEVEIRACALHAVELIVAALPHSCAADVDQLLWLRGGGRAYKARPRHRCRCTAY